MSSFTLHISTDNAAFQDDDHALATILREVADRVEMAEDSGTVRDYNGNTCGRFFKTDRDASDDDSAVLDAIVSHLDSLAEWEADTIEDVCEWIARTGRKLDPGEAHA